MPLVKLVMDKIKQLDWWRKVTFDPLLQDTGEKTTLQKVKSHIFNNYSNFNSCQKH